MAVLVFLAAAARARIVAADALAAVANRFRPGIDIAAGIGLLLTPLEFFGRAGSLGMDRSRLDPGGADKLFVELLHLENQARRLVADRAPHLLEQLHPFALVLDFWIDLGVTDQADAAAEPVH